MTFIKLYNRDFSQTITTLGEQDFSGLSYTRKLGEIGDCQFVVRLDKDKIVDANFELYSRIEVIEDGNVVFIGVITRRDIGLDTARMRCRELTYVLKRRLMGQDYVVNNTVANVITSLLNSVNSADETGIALGNLEDAIGSINATYNQNSAFEIIKQICKATNNQFILNADRELVIANQVGEDKTESAILRYNINHVSASNILKFSVEDDGEEIVTKAYGKSGGNSSTQENVTLKGQYGLLEKYRDFRVANTSGVLDEFTEAEISDRIFSPDIDLNPNTPDNFELADTVRIVLKNALIDIDDSFQVLEKRVQYIGNQKRIAVRINDLPQHLAEKLAERDARLDLLEKQL